MTNWWLGGFGSDQDGTARGISIMSSRPDGSLELGPLVVEAPSAAYLASTPSHVYAVAEGSGRVRSFLRDGEGLREDGVVESGGVSPCHLTLLDGALVVANYMTGDIGVISLADSGAVDRLEQLLPGSGSGPHPAQDGPHAHASLLLDDSTLLSVDLGADRIFIHGVEGPRLTRTGEFALPAGTGPRDIVRHPSGLIYVLGEHAKDLHVLERDGSGLRGVASVALPGREVTDQAAAISFGPRGFVYAGLRGSNQIAVLHASPDGREVTPVGAVSCAGDWPRHSVVHGDLLHVSNQLSNSVATFRLGVDGMPVLVADPTPAPSPSYLLPL